MKKKLTIAASLAIGAGLFWLACRQVNLHALAGILWNVKPGPLLLVCLTVSTELAIRGIKWSLLLAPAGKARVWDVLRIEAAGLALNNVLPLRLGDVVRGTFAADFLKINIVTVFSTILAEKALDLAALFVLSSAAAALSGIAAAGSGRGLFLMSAALSLVVVFFAASWGLSSSRIKKFPGLEKTLNSLALGLKAFASPMAAAAVCSLALLQWFLNSLNYYWLALAFGMENTVTVVKSVLLSLTGAAASSVPGMPGYFGSFELAVSAVLAAWGINKEAALSYAFAAHILSYMIITAAGLIFIYQLGHSLEKIWSEFSKQKRP